jgi:NAD(P)-dependent dehydrogenase (short-subunit alcohol dehydrogenase family)
LLHLDVNSDESVSNSLGKVIAEKKKVNVLVNNAGYGLLGALEELSMNNIKAQFETNFFGAIRCIKEIIPVMRQQRSGIIEPGCINSDFLDRLVISNNTQDSKSPYLDMFKKFTANYFKAMTTRLHLRPLLR